MDSVNPGRDHTPAQVQEWPVRFTGSGSEYFRIWIVNLLLILVTLGLYVPFAKQRRIAYFCANTRVADQALAFHGDPWRMFRGFVLLGALAIVYGVASHVAPVAGLVAFVVLCAAWPALWRAGLQFRLGNTSWRGLRLAFTGDLPGAYKVMLPVFVPLMAFVATSVLLGPGEQEPASARPTGGLIVIALLMLFVLAVPLSMAATRRYQHGGYRLGRQQARIELRNRSVYATCAKAVVVAIVPAMAVAAVVGILAAMLVPAVAGGAGHGLTGLLLGMGIGLAYFSAAVASVPYLTARLQNLAWNGTRSEALAFASQLRMRPLLWLTLRNWLLVVLTLGLYRPFAVVATARLRLEAVTLICHGDLVNLLGDAASRPADATGEAAGDFFGFDLGL